MIPVVSDKYRYVFFYNPKSACSVARKIFLDLHRDELTADQVLALQALRDANQDDWHDVNNLFPFRLEADYRDYYKFTLVRHPAMRAVSAYLNRVVLKQTDQAKMEAKLATFYGSSVDINFSFMQFLDYLSCSAQDELDNMHFASQSSFPPPLKGFLLCSPFYRRYHAPLYSIRRFFGHQAPPLMLLDGVCKVETLASDLRKVYNKVFANAPQKLAAIEQKLSALPLHNATYTSSELEPGAHHMAAIALRDRGRMPNYQSFLNDETLPAIERLFAEDLSLFNYELVPGLKTRNFEQQKHERVQSCVPSSFDWRYYVAVNPDLPQNGIDNKADALNHWIHHGRFEERDYCSKVKSDDASSTD